MDEAVAAFLAHYASDNYDPVKAREYYLRTRELKGGRSTAGMSTEQREAIGYAKTQISTKKKDELESLKTNQEAAVTALREKSEATQASLQQKLDSMVSSIRDNLEAKLATILDIEPMEVIPPPKFNTIPDTASPKQKEFLQRQNALIAGRHNGLVDAAQKEYTKKADAAKANAQAVRSSGIEAMSEARAAASSEIRQVGEGLKAAVVKARADYAASREQVVAKYEAATDQEFENVRSQIAGKPEPSPKAKTAKKSKEAKAATESATSDAKLARREKLRATIASLATPKSK